MVCKRILFVESLVVEYSQDGLDNLNSSTVPELVYNEIRESKIFSVVNSYRRQNHF